MPTIYNSKFFQNKNEPVHVPRIHRCIARFSIHHTRTIRVGTGISLQKLRGNVAEPEAEENWIILVETDP
jgi:hypothetical protein